VAGKELSARSCYGWNTNGERAIDKAWFWPACEVDVLKISIAETATDRRWILQGRLVGPWVGELRATWKRTHRSQDRRACIIDLNDVTFIDKSGERLLRAMSKKGAQLLARGLYVKHVLEQLKTGSKRDLITLIVCLFAGLQVNVMVPVTHGQAPSARMAMKVEEDSGLRFDLANSRSRSTGSTRNSGEVGAAPCR
jgi:anti-anti-sigma regulatory factor